MRLLDTITGGFVEKDPRDPETKYAILSHTWDHEGEQTYQEVMDIQRRYITKRQRPQPWPRRDFQSNSPSSAEHHHSEPFLTHSDPSHLSHNPSSTTFVGPVSGLPPDARAPGQFKTPLSPIWDDAELSPKIREACIVAQTNGYRYIWIDSCCIDKTSSSELSESINSMYQWYARAEVCYTFLADVLPKEDPRGKDSHFRRSRWFTRGWTLQELIAPVHLVFLSMDWTFIGSKHSLASLVSEITNVGYNALLRVEPLKEFSVAQRLSWALRRQTMRVEDRAYSLLGIFDINMSTLYGEGEGAFRRLQEEIMRRIPDQSLFAWGNVYLGSWRFHKPDPAPWRSDPRILRCSRYRDPNYGTISLLAPTLEMFAECSSIEAISHGEVVRRLQDILPVADYTFTPHGIRTQLPMVQLSRIHFPPDAAISSDDIICPDDIPISQWYLVILGCEHKGVPGNLLGRVCYIPPSGSNVDFMYCGRVSSSSLLEPGNPSVHLLPLLPPTIQRLRSESSHIDFKTAYIFHPDKADRALEVALRHPHETIKLVLQRKTCDTLYTQGYTANLEGGSQARLTSTTHWLTLFHNKHIITIEYQHTLEDNGLRLTVHAHVKMTAPPLQPSGNPYVAPDPHRHLVYPSTIS